MLVILSLVNLPASGVAVLLRMLVAARCPVHHPGSGAEVLLLASGEAVEVDCRRTSGVEAEVLLLASGEAAPLRESGVEAEVECRRMLVVVQCPAIHLASGVVHLTMLVADRCLEGRLDMLVDNQCPDDRLDMLADNRYLEVEAEVAAEVAATGRGHQFMDGYGCRLINRRSSFPKKAARKPNRKHN
jgi:hypothetical protein